MATPEVTLTGKLYDLSGTPVAGTVTVTLSSYGAAPIMVAGTGLIAAQSVTVDAADDGTFSIALWGNYQLNVPTSFYSIAASDGSSEPLWATQYQFTAGGSYDLSTLDVYIPSTVANYAGNPVYIVSSMYGTIGAPAPSLVISDTTNQDLYELTISGGSLSLTKL